MAEVAIRVVVFRVIVFSMVKGIRSNPYRSVFWLEMSLETVLYLQAITYNQHSLVPVVCSTTVRKSRGNAASNLSASKTQRTSEFQLTLDGYEDLP
jgi:hypothetical protein